MPDTNRPGWPISFHDSESEWVQPETTPTNDPHKDLLHHLIQSHAGELRAVGSGSWKRFYGQPPEALFHPQFASTPEQKAAMADYKIVLEKGHRRKGKGSASASGGKGGTGKGKGKGPASGGSERPMGTRFGTPGFQSRILHIHDENTYYVWGGAVISLPRLLHCLGAGHSASDLYAYWHTLNIIVTQRPHAWSKETRQVAAFKRYEQFGHWGHRD